MDFEQYLSSKEDTSVSPETLKQLGGKAAAQYIQKERPLNESISEMAKESSLNMEQIKRVSEYANNATFAHLFKGSYDKNITFPMADAAAIMQLKDTPQEKTASRQVLPKGRYIPGQEYVSIDDVFGAEEIEKVAGVSESERGVLAKKFLDMKIQRDGLSSDVDILADQFAVKLSSLKQLCKEAQAEGYSSSTIGAAIEACNPSEGLREVIEIDFEDLVEFGYTEKLAMHGMALMPGNPISGLTQDLESVSGKLVGAQQAMHRVNTSMSELLTILRGPDPGHTMANQVFNPGGMGSEPAPPPQGPASMASPSPAGGPPGAAMPSPSPQAAGGPPVSPVSGGAPGGKNLGALFGGK